MRAGRGSGLRFVVVALIVINGQIGAPVGAVGGMLPLRNTVGYWQVEFGVGRARSARRDTIG